MRLVIETGEQEERGGKRVDRIGKHPCRKNAMLFLRLPEVVPFTFPFILFFSQEMMDMLYMHQ